MLILLWILSGLLIVLPEHSHLLWRMDFLDRDLFIHYGGLPILSYCVGNIGGMIFIVAAIRKTTRTPNGNTKTSLLIAGIAGIIAIGVVSYVGMGNYTMEFVAG